jgi:curved DNA-binding protein CbpA
MTLKKALQIFNLEDLSGVTQTDLKSLYKKLAKAKHPDSTGGEDKEFVELQDAFNTLSKYVHTDKGTGKDLHNLSKEEILDKYFEDTKVLQKQVTDFRGTFQQQNQVMQEIKTKIEELINDFEAKKAELRAQLEKEVSKLEKKYSDGIFKRLLFFIPKMTEEEFWNTYREQASKYSKKHLELDVEFLKEMLTTYGEGLNNIQKSTEAAAREED